MKKKNIIFLNLQDTFPKVKVNNYLFSKGQRMSMGLPVVEKERLKEFFRFFNNIFGAENIYLSYVKNLDENKDCAGIIEEIKLKYEVKPKFESSQAEISPKRSAGELPRTLSICRVKLSTDTGS